MKQLFSRLVCLLALYNIIIMSFVGFIVLFSVGFINIPVDQNVPRFSFTWRITINIRIYTFKTFFSFPQNLIKTRTPVETQVRISTRRLKRPGTLHVCNGNCIEVGGLLMAVL